MANTFSTQRAKLNTLPLTLTDGNREFDSRVKVNLDVIPYAAQAAADTITCQSLPKGATPVAFILNTSDTTGTATLAIGDGTTPTYFSGAGAVLTTPDTPTHRLKTSVAGTKLTAETPVVITVGVAPLPSAGAGKQLVVHTLYTLD